MFLFIVPNIFFMVPGQILKCRVGNIVLWEVVVLPDVYGFGRINDVGVVEEDAYSTRGGMYLARPIVQQMLCDSRETGHGQYREVDLEVLYLLLCHGYGRRHCYFLYALCVNDALRSVMEHLVRFPPSVHIIIMLPRLWLWHNGHRSSSRSCRRHSI